MRSVVCECCAQAWEFCIRARFKASHVRCFAAWAVQVAVVDVSLVEAGAKQVRCCWRSADSRRDAQGVSCSPFGGIRFDSVAFATFLRGWVGASGLTKPIAALSPRKTTLSVYTIVHYSASKPIIFPPIFCILIVNPFSKFRVYENLFSSRRLPHSGCSFVCCLYCSKLIRYSALSILNCFEL